MNAASLADLERSSFRIQRRREIDQDINSHKFEILISEHPLSNNTSNYNYFYCQREIRENRITFQE